MAQELIVEPPRHPLTARMYEMVMLAGDGYTTEEIAGIAGCAFGTARETLHQARRRLGVHSSAQAYTELQRRLRGGHRR